MPNLRSTLATAMAVMALGATIATVNAASKEEPAMSQKSPPSKDDTPPPTNVPRPSGPKPMKPDPTREDRDDYDADDDDDDRSAPPVAAPKRAAPVRVPEVTIGGTIYRQHRGPVQGIDQNSGLLAAWQPGADAPDWVIGVYPVEYRDHLERDVQEVYFIEMFQEGEKRVLIIVNERGERWTVDVTTRESSQLE